MSVFLLFFFKQKTAYEMRISDWSSDVCSSDLAGLLAIAAIDAFRHVDVVARGAAAAVGARLGLDGDGLGRADRLAQLAGDAALLAVGKIGRASCRERVRQYV